jgi:hypothetical protein
MVCEAPLVQSRERQLKHIAAFVKESGGTVPDKRDCEYIHSARARRE